MKRVKKGEREENVRKKEKRREGKKRKKELRVL